MPPTPYRDDQGEGQQAREGLAVRLKAHAPAVPLADYEARLEREIAGLPWVNEAAVVAGVKPTTS